MNNNSELDEFYLRFENHVRGSREDIKERQRVYLRLLEILMSDVRSNFRLLDIGCGRGEWLELLKEERFSAYGADLNQTMVAVNQERGLDVRHEDAVEHLSSLPDDSLSAITGFHIIEHLPFEVLFRLFREAKRVLVPGGFILFETPNPENLQVGAHTFYYDPTHVKPLSPRLLSFMSEDSGYAHTEIIRLHPFEGYATAFIESTSLYEHELAGTMYAPQDFSVFAVKATEDESLVDKYREVIIQVNENAVRPQKTLAEHVNALEKTEAEQQAQLAEMTAYAHRLRSSYSYRYGFYLVHPWKLPGKVLSKLFGRNGLIRRMVKWPLRKIGS